MQVQYPDIKPANFRYDFGALRLNDSFEVDQESVHSCRNAGIQYVRRLNVAKRNKPKFSTVKCEDGKYRCFRIK